MTDTHIDAHGHGQAHAGPKHPYHLVDPSPWPIVGSIAAGSLAAGAGVFMHGYGWGVLAIGFIARLATKAVGWRGVIRAAALEGLHTPGVSTWLRYRVALFISPPG